MLPYEEEAQEFELSSGKKVLVRELDGLEDARIIGLLPRDALYSANKYTLAAQVIAIDGDRLRPEQPQQFLDLEVRLKKLRAREWDDIAVQESIAFALPPAVLKNSSGGDSKEPS